MCHTKIPSLFQKRSECTGCGACASVCPANAIAITPDEEGFPAPVIDQMICTGCGTCIAHCPMKHPEHEKESGMPSFHAARYDDGDVLFHSTSGGAFTALSDAVL